MKYDLLLPQENETELLEATKELGVIPIFLYCFKDKKEIQRKKEELKKVLRGKYFVGVYTIPKSPADIKKLTKLFWLTADFLAVINPGELIRAAVSNPRIDAVFRVPTIFGKDSTEYRRSNFNTILANLCARNKIAYGIDFSSFLEHSGYSLAKLLGREMQNIRLCRRKVPILIASMAKTSLELRLPENLAAVGRILGLNHLQSKAAVSTAIQNILVQKEKRRSPKFVRPGIELVD